MLDYIQDLNGNGVTLARDSNNRVTAVTYTNGDVIVFNYNAQSRIGQMTDAVGRTTTFLYDVSGEHLLSVTNAAGTTSFTYVTGKGAAQEHAIESITYPDGTHTFYEYDQFGRLIRKSRDGGAESVTLSYGKAGGLTLTDAAGAVTKVLYNRFGEAIEITTPLNRVARHSRDKARNVISVETGGAKFFLDYDENGNLVSFRDPLGYQSSMSYTPLYNRLTALTDARGQTTQYRRDSHYDLTSITYPNGSSQRFNYDPRGNLIQWINRRGHAVSFSYDAKDLLIRKDYVNGSHDDFTYDGHRNLLTATDSTGATSFSYDAADRLTKITYPSGRFLAYTYDTGGRRIRMVDQDGFTTSYAYDSAGRLTGLTDGNGSPMVSYTYDPVGRVARKDMGNGAYSTFEYDLSGQVVHYINYAPNGSVSSRFDYAYDDFGRKIRMTTLEGDWTYHYDLAGQLTSVTLPNGRSIDYVYDAAGNRVSVTDNGQKADYSTTNLNQYVTIGTAIYSYDADGNLVSKTDGSNTWTYTYDDQNRFIGLAGPDGTWAFRYDTFGNRVGAVHNGQQTEYLIDPFGLGNVVAEYDSTGSAVAHYTHGLNLVSRIDPTDGSAYYLFDGNGNTAQLIGPQGNVLNSYNYLPFGEPLNRAETVPNPFTFAGQYGVTNETKDLYFMRNRWYDPQQGRFVQPDPIDIAGGDVNLYRYVMNDPVNLVESEGLISVFLCQY